MALIVVGNPKYLFVSMLQVEVRRLPLECFEARVKRALCFRASLALRKQSCTKALSPFALLDEQYVHEQPVEINLPPKAA